VRSEYTDVTDAFPKHATVFVAADTEAMRIDFTDGTTLYFLTTKGIPRIMYQKVDHVGYRGDPRPF